MYLNPSNLSALPFGKLIFDNGGAPGGKSGILSAINQADLFITNGTSVAIGPVADGVWNNLTISSNSSLTLASNVQTMNLTISSNLTIQAGGALTVDGQGVPANNGVGHGIGTLNSGSGGGHGGLGSAGINVAAGGGVNYDSIISPSIAGSGGGSKIGRASCRERV